MMNKYHAKKTALCAKCGAEHCSCLVDKIVFDSKKEGRYYQVLLLMKKAGQITDIQLQPKYELVPGFNHRGKRYRAITYKADFKVFHSDGRVEVVDVKGKITEAYSVRKRLLLSKYPEIWFTEG